jgi:hypothetical protein
MVLFRESPLRLNIKERLAPTKIIELLNRSGWGIRLAFGIVKRPRETKRAGQHTADENSDNKVTHGVLR